MNTIWAEAAGVDVLLHAQVSGVLRDGERVTGVVVESLAGRQAYRAKVVIDATGDAVVAHLAGARMHEDHTAHQPQSLLFRLSNVDVKRFRAIPREEKRALALAGIARGELFWESLSFMSTPGGSDAICLMSRIRDHDPLDPRQAAHAEREGRRQVHSITRFLQREVPGFEHAILAGIAARVGVRESRRVIGQYTLTERDILDQVSFDDAIALGSGPMDIHDAHGTGIELFMPPAPFEIPLRCLVPLGCDGLLITGRAISATHGANGGARHMATAMALGQAAGTMAWVAATGANATQAIPVRPVQEALRADGAVVTRTECLARAPRTEVAEAVAAS